MNTRTTLAYLLSAALVGVVTLAEAGPSPNVLLIITHDMTTALGAYGNKAVPTPNIDRLASMGVRFSNAFTNYPLCNPARTSMLSGVYPESSGVYDNSTSPRKYLGSQWVMLPEHFDNFGYRTGRVGTVSHSGYDRLFRWDIDINQPEPIRPPPPYNIVDSGVIRDVVWWQATTQADEDTRDGNIARYASNLIETYAAEPFFIAVGFKQTHWPWIIPKEYFDNVKLSRIKLPLERGEPFNDKDDIPLVALRKFSDWSGLETDENRRRFIRAAFASHTFLDANVGVLMDTLTRLDLWKNTVVVLIVDHGFHYGEHGGLTGKQTLFKESTRIPLIIVAPGKAANKVAFSPVESVDLYPTLSEICGLPIRTENEGISLLPQLVDPTRERDRPGYSIVVRSSDIVGRSIKSGRYRYTEWTTTPLVGELYDHSVDPGEFTNQFDKPDFGSIRESMAKKLRKAQERPLLKRSAALAPIE